MRRGKGARGAGLAAIGMTTLALLAPSLAEAAPGNPGVPGPPTLVFADGFENGMGTTPILLTGYIGAPPQSETYTADAPWVSGEGCNGIIISQTSSNFPGCNWNAQIKALANTLGVFAGDPTPADNHAVSAYTDGNPGAGLVELESVQPIPTGGPDRFITFSIDAAAHNCSVAHPLLAFYLLDGGTERAAFSSPIDACGAPSGGRYTANQPILLAASSLGLRMRNNQGSGNGNDFAVDNIRVLDATPQLDKSFGAPVVQGGAPATLTFTVTNTDDLLPKPGWSFTDTLPAGMTVSSPNGVSTDCPGASVVAAPGSGSIAVSGNLSANMVSCTVNVNVTANGGRFDNGPGNVTQTGLQPPGRAQVQFIPADMTGTKAPLGQFVRGTQGQYEIVATNSGVAATTDTVTVSDVVPTGLTPTAASGTGWGCGIATQTVTCTRSDALAGGASYPPITITVDVALDAPASITNTATITCPFPCDQGPPGTATSTHPVVSRVDLSVVKTADPTSILASQQTTFTMVVHNAGPSIAEDVVLDDPLPGGLIAISATPSQGACATAPAPYRCALGSLQPGAQATVAIVAEAENSRPPAENTLTNTATVSSSTTETSPTDNTDSADLEIRRTNDLLAVKTTVTRPPIAGAQVTFEIRVTNNGPSDALDTVVEDPMPATFTPGTGSGIVVGGLGTCAPAPPATIRCEIPSIPVGQSVTVAVTGTLRSDTAGQPLTNQACANNDADPLPGDNCDSPPTETIEALADIEVVKTGPDRVLPTNEIAYDVTIRNNGPSDAPGVVLTDTLPEGTTFVSIDPACPVAGREITCDVGSLTAAEARTYHVVVDTQLSQVGQTLENSARGTSSVPDPVDANNASRVSTTVDQASDLSLVKSAPATVNAEQDLKYTLVVTNAGPSASPLTVVEDTLPDGIQFLSVTSPQGTCAAAGQAVRCDLGTLAVGQSVTIEILVRPAASLANTRPRNSAAVRGAHGDFDPANNSGTAEVGVLAPLPDLTVSKSRTAGIMRSGERVTFTVVVANGGNGPATNVVVIDRLPGGLRFVSGRSSAGTCTGTQEFVCQVGTIAARAVVRITVVAEVRTTGSLINTAVATAAERDLNPLDNRADLRSDASGRVEPVLRKRAGVRSARRGQSIPYTITMRNPGAGGLSGVSVCDRLPSGLTYVPGTARPATRLRGGRLCWRVASLAEGSSRTFRLRARVDADVRSDRVANMATASGPGMRPQRTLATVGLSGVLGTRAEGVTG